MKKPKSLFIPNNGREAEIFERLSAAEDLLAYATDRDHYCEDQSCSVSSPKCADMHAEAALQAIRDLLEPPHMSLQPKRLSNDAERIYLQRWQALNERQPAINSGFTALEWILCPDGERPTRVTQRDAAVAASVVQWLGTNCGMSLVQASERDIEKARAERSKWTRVALSYDPPKPELLQQAEALAGPLTAKPEYRQLVLSIAAALDEAKKQGAAEARQSMREALK